MAVAVPPAPLDKVSLVDVGPDVDASPVAAKVSSNAPEEEGVQEASLSVTQRFGGRGGPK